MIIIQPFQKKYGRQVQALISTIQRKEFNLPITLEQQSDLLDISGYYQKDKGDFWIALDGDSVIGTIALLDIGHGNAAIRKLFVKKEYRRKSVATKLLDQLLEWAEAYQLKQIYLETIAIFPSAHRFYEKNGFVKIDITELPRSFPVMSAESKFYCREI